MQRRPNRESLREDFYRYNAVRLRLLAKRRLGRSSAAEREELTEVCAFLDQIEWALSSHERAAVEEVMRRFDEVRAEADALSRRILGD